MIAPKPNRAVETDVHDVLPKMTRREMVGKLLAGIASGAVWPIVGSSHPIHALLDDGATLDRADAASHASDWQPLFLNQQQDRALAELAEAIVPGSRKAQVNRFIDLVLSVDTTANQEKFAASMAALLSASQEKFGRAFAQQTASEKEEFLTHISTDPAGSKPFDEIKEWVSLAYYSSEDGMRDLGWTGEHAFRNLPDCSTNTSVSH